MAALSTGPDADRTAAQTGGTGLGLRSVRWAMVGVWALNVCHGILAGTLSTSALWTVWLGFAAGLLGAVLLTRPGSDRLETADALGVVLCAFLTGFAISGWTELPEPPSHVWIFNYASYLPALLVARGNSVAGGIGGALVVLTGYVWASFVGTDSTGYVDLLGIPVTALLVGYTWRVALRRMSTREEAYELAEAQARSERLEAEAAEIATRRELAVVAARVFPLLSAIEKGQPIDDDLALRLSVAEAGIRDRIRSPRLQHPVLTAAIAESRRRGVEVVLFGEDPDERPSPGRVGAGPRVAIGDALAEAVAGRIAPVRGGRVMIRLSPSRGRTALTLTVTAGGSTRRTDLSADGEIVAVR